jgi:hypothetical protein
MTAYTGRKIDESGVSLERRKHPEYKRLYSKLKKELTASHSIEIFCVHEAGHLIFFRQAGFTEFDFLGPTMTYDDLKPYDDESKRYNYFLAAVRTPEASRIDEYNENVLIRLAGGAAAGEVFNEVRQQCPPVPIDKSSDFDGFDEHCRKALRYDNEIGYDAKGRWGRARDEVKAYLEDRTNETKIQSAITEVRYGCFKLR